MRTILALTVLAAVATAMTPGFSGCQVTDFGTPMPVTTATWHDIQHASTITKITMVAAWGGTATVFAMLPWHDKPWALTVAQIAAGVAITGILGGMMLGGE
jgi:hypothetical protein